MPRAEITDAVCLAALRGWCGYAPDTDLSPYQQSTETKAAWRRAINAALDELGRQPDDSPQPSELGCP